eukprot:INCI16167.3.p1 GENE.INCI16167.3~~INCI16167.3.p1  ORF type:complete len:158 (+),score=16.88 INCI16167.3:175-648(+)
MSALVGVAAVGSAGTGRYTWALQESVLVMFPSREVKLPYRPAERDIDKAHHQAQQAHLKKHSVATKQTLVQQLNGTDRVTLGADSEEVSGRDVVHVQVVDVGNACLRDSQGGAIRRRSCDGDAHHDTANTHRGGRVVVSAGDRDRVGGCGCNHRGKD